MDGMQRRGAVVSVGFAVGASDAGIAYASATQFTGERQTYRVPFVCRALPALQGRDVTYAAVAAVAGELARASERTSRLRVTDAHLVDDLSERRSLPQALAMPYVVLRCTLNRLGDVAIALCDDGACRDLEARARAEVSLDVAA